MTSKLVLVTGATGYIASRLIPRLLERGYRVRALARHPQRLAGRSWSRHVEIVSADVTHPASLAPALQGVWTAYYLIHNMTSGRGYISRDLQGAHNFASAAENAGLAHVIYLGGLADPNARNAAHLRSRLQTGEALRQGRVPVTELRAGVIIGPGSTSFEMIRFMTELVPLVPGPRSLNNRIQPIATQNVLDYLLAALKDPAGRGQILEIGGPDVMTYGKLMLEYARLRGLKRSLMTLPYVPLWFMAFGVSRFAPVSSFIAHGLLDGLRTESLVREPLAQRIFPDIKLIAYEAAVRAALADLRPAMLEPVWTDRQRPLTSIKHEGFFIHHRRLHVQAAPEQLIQVVRSLGGKNGWLYVNWLWKLRGWIDRLFSPRSREGREELNNSSRSSSLRGEIPNIGERIDFYRVETIAPDQMLLHSELKAPGEGWMEWRVEAGERGSSILTQTSFFAPRGLPGFLYWYGLYPFHTIVFRGLMRAIARKSRA